MSTSRSRLSGSSPRVVGTTSASAASMYGPLDSTPQHHSLHQQHLLNTSAGAPSSSIPSSPPRLLSTFPRAVRTKSLLPSSATLRRRLQNPLYDEDDDDDPGISSPGGADNNDEEDEEALAQFERRSAELLRGSGTNRKLAQHCPQCKRMVDVTLKAKAERNTMEELARKLEEEKKELMVSLARCKQKKETTTRMLREELDQTAEYVRSQYESHQKELNQVQSENSLLKTALETARKESERQLTEARSRSGEETLKLQFDLEQARKYLQSKEETAFRLESQVDELKRDRDDLKREKEEVKDRLAGTAKECEEIKIELVQARRLYDDLVSASQQERAQIREGYEKELSELRETLHRLQSEHDTLEEQAEQDILEERQRLAGVHQAEMDALRREQERVISELRQSIHTATESTRRLTAELGAAKRSETELKAALDSSQKEHNKAIEALKAMYEQQLQRAQSNVKDTSSETERLQTELQQTRESLGKSLSEALAQVQEMQKARNQDLDLFKQQYEKQDRMMKKRDNDRRHSAGQKIFRLLGMITALVSSLGMFLFMWTPKMVYSPGLEFAAALKETMLDALGLLDAPGRAPPM